MGVSLSSLVKGKEIDFDTLKDRTVAIDAYNTIYQFLSTIRDRFTGEPLRNSKGNVTSHLSGLFYRTSKILEAGITPIFVFDGKPPEFKRKTIEERMKIRASAEAKWKQAVKEGDHEKVRIYSQGAVRLTKDMAEQAKVLLELMGVSWVQAPSEGEAQATHMMKNGQAWAVASQDWDSLMFGAERMVKNLTVSGKRKLPGRHRFVDVSPEIIRLKEVLSKLGITREQLVMLGILVGTDYNPKGVKGIGPKNALKLVKEGGEVSKVFSGVKWEFDISPESIFDFFINPPVSDVEIKNYKLDSDKLIEFMSEENEFSKDRITNSVRKLEKFGKEKNQKGLHGFFGK